ncbi:mediator of RNA polymerase II transcription subunit 1-like isoform X2 [Eriocheir sinensis]|uniref:mediator of RNA polymerase II transcription subunit 1-like isoform X2 n=1 Tax=Eriocheir sinensis TaxID=95602 RepID=UPI0021C73723|nr:mediator of RNA polymerase II transcription subunit 1-like isoform X2 [Eriocheir sinensis]
MAAVERPLLDASNKTLSDDGGVTPSTSVLTSPTSTTTTTTATTLTTTTTATTTSTTTTTTTSTAWQMEVLMERLRSKAGGFRSLVESAKGIKQAIMKKQHLLDPGERATLGSCLDSLQKNIKVTSLSAMVERLEATARQLGLKFTAGTSGSEVFVSCDMFYVEVLLEPDGRVRDVKVELAGDQSTHEGLSSPELMECLSRGDFADFTAHLDGFSSIYQLNADKKIKSKAFQALQALETDLTKLFELAQETITDPYKLVLKSPVGLLQRRRGGHAMRLVYFVSPYELLDVAAGRAVTLTTDTPHSRELSHYVTVNIEASNSHKLQTTTLMLITKQANGKKLPSFSGLTTDNSMTLPACFSLKLRRPMPVSLALLQRINEVTGLECVDPSNQQSLIPLIIQQAADTHSECNSNRGLFVTLPDQQHCYFMTSAGEVPGVMVTCVPFTHPTHITSILMCLRAQAAFNALIASCVRPASKQASSPSDLDSAYIFEVTAASHEYISVTFEHPQEESTATAEIDLTDLCNARCRLHTLTPDPGFCSEEYVTKVLQRCMSIPVTMRAVMRKVAKEERKDAVMSGDSAVMMGSGKLNSDFNQNTTKFLLNEYDKLGMRRDQLMAPHMTNLNNVVTNTSHNYYNTPFPPGQHTGTTDASATASTNPLAALGNAVQEAGTPLGYGALLGAMGHKSSISQPFLGEVKSAKVRKKKSVLDPDRKSPKYIEDVIDLDDRSSDSYLGDAVSSLVEMKQRDIKVEKVPSVLSKRRSSNDSGTTDIATSDLAALREQVYGAASAANYAKINSYSIKDSKDVKKVKKQRTDGHDSRKSPIVLDLTEAETSSKKSGSSGSSSHSSSASLSAALLKRPGIEIIPIPGSNTPISIPSSITVTPVLKSGDDKYKDKKERRDKKDLDRKDKKRKREDSPSNSTSSSSTSGGSSSSSSKPAKVQIISSGLKHSSLSFKGDGSSKSGLSAITVKPSTPPYQSPSKKPSLSPSLSKSILPGKVSVSPTHKPNKVIYSPTQSGGQSSSPKGRSSPKPSTGSPKHPSMSPKHTSLGKPSMTQLKSASPTFSKPSLSPKLKSKEKERSSSSSPSRPVSSSSSTPSSTIASSVSSSSASSSSISSSTLSSSTSSTSSSSLSVSSSSVTVTAAVVATTTTTTTSTTTTTTTTPTTTSSSSTSSSSSGSAAPKVKTSSSSSSSSSSSNTSMSEKIKNGLSDALTITKVSTGETASSASLSSSFLASTQPHTAPASLDDKPPVFSVDKAKASPPKNRKGPSLSDIVDKLRVGVGNSSDAVTIIEKNDKGQKESSKGDGAESKKEGEKKTEFTVKPSTGGLKLTINKAKKKDESSKSLSTSSPKPTVSKSPSGLKPGVVSGPASKKVSMSSLPPIPKLPRSSMSSVTATAVSPLGTTLPGMHSSPLQYQRERTKEKEKDRVNSADRLKPKDSSPAKSLGPISEPKKESIVKTPLPKQTPKEDHGLGLSHRKLESSETTEKPSKTVPESRTDKLDKPGPLKAEADSTLGATSDSTSSTSKTADTFMDKGSSTTTTSTTTTTTTTSSSSSVTNDTSTTSAPAIPLAAAPSSSSDLIRSQDSFTAPSFKSSKEAKEDGKSKSEATLPPYRPPVTSSSTSGGTVDHILDPTPPPLPPPPPPPPPPPSSTTSTTVSTPAISPLRQAPLHTTLAKGIDSKEPVGAASQDPVPEKTKISESLSSSISSAQTTSLPGLGYPPSPSVSIKIVKSPAPVPSPLNMISPHSVASQPSPCIIDDELMDEALMGTRK